MTFGEKLKVLRKEHGHSQEEFAQQMNVSRQAVSKWESDRGTPETDKLLQISTMYGVTLDYLLKSECAEDGHQNNGYYVSREMIDGYLAYKRQGAKRIAIGVSLLILSSTFMSIFDFTQLAMILFGVTTALGAVVLMWHIFQPKRYMEIGTQPLLFDDAIIKEFRVEHEKTRKQYGVMVIVGVVLLALSPFIMMFTLNNLGFGVGSTFMYVLTAASVSLFILAGFMLRAENVIARNAEYMSKRGRAK
jgi:transcriptional regulator with XRE-family HTH domain